MYAWSRSCHQPATCNAFAHVSEQSDKLPASYLNVLFWRACSSGWYHHKNGKLRSKLHFAHGTTKVHSDKDAATDSSEVNAAWVRVAAGVGGDNEDAGSRSRHWPPGIGTNSGTGRMWITSVGRRRHHRRCHSSSSLLFGLLYLSVLFRSPLSPFFLSSPDCCCRCWNWSWIWQQNMEEGRRRRVGQKEEAGFRAGSKSWLGLQRFELFGKHWHQKGDLSPKARIWVTWGSFGHIVYMTSRVKLHG